MIPNLTLVITLPFFFYPFNFADATQFFGTLIGLFKHLPVIHLLSPMFPRLIYLSMMFKTGRRNAPRCVLSRSGKIYLLTTKSRIRQSQRPSPTGGSSRTGRVWASCVNESRPVTKTSTGRRAMSPHSPAGTTSTRRVTKASARGTGARSTRIAEPTGTCSVRRPTGRRAGT